MRILSSINHRFLVGYKEAFQSKIGEVCLVMEFIGGGDLSEKIWEHYEKKLFINENKIWSYFIQILLAVKKLHENWIIHRDIKSANIFLTED